MPLLKNLAAKPPFLPTRRQWEARNFEMAQHIDKQKIYISSTINILKMVPNLEHHPTGLVLMLSREKIDKL